MSQPICHNLSGPRQAGEFEFRGSPEAQSLKAALKRALVMLRPDVQWKNPALFVAEFYAMAGLVLTIAALANGYGGIWIVGLASVDLCLLLTVLIGTLAAARAEARIIAACESQDEIPAYRVRNHGGSKRIARADGTVDSKYYQIEKASSASLRAGDVVLVEANQVVPGDGAVVEGTAFLDESVITGETAPVLREAGGDRCAVLAGSQVLSGRILVCITAVSG